MYQDAMSLLLSPLRQMLIRTHAHIQQLDSVRNAVGAETGSCQTLNLECVKVSFSQAARQGIAVIIKPAPI